MGLDMYLYKRHYIRHSNIYKDEFIDEITIKTGGELNNKINFKKITYVIEEIAYWRKFNSLHNWFVRHCQDGNDDCKDYYVSYKNILELLNTLKKVNENPSLAGDLLPTQSGFFFGGIYYDEWYFKNINQAIETLQNIVNNSEEGDDFIYDSSW